MENKPLHVKQQEEAKNEQKRSIVANQTTRYTITTAEFEYKVSSDFSDVPAAADIENAVIDRIIVRYNNYIASLTVHYVGSKHPAIQRGGEGNRGTSEACHVNLEHYMNEVVLESDEWITQIEGNYLPRLISGIKFVSNTGRTWGPFGYGRGTEFILNPGNEIPFHLASRMGLLYFAGNCGNYVYQLQATLAEYARPATPARLLKFERQTADKLIVQSTRAVSAFARQLMSTVITLRIGHDLTEFHVYKVIICRLPFFQAVLQGELKSAPSEAITMPDDQPDTIGALLEFLYTGTYTYVFNPPATPNECSTADIPVSQLCKGYFHVAVYAVASKYEFEVLLQGALENFKNVLKQLSGLDVIELLKAAYLEGLYLPQFEGDDNLHSFMGGLPKLVGDLYGSNRQEMEDMVAEYSELGSDLLRLVSTVTDTE